jgi:NAD(P)-dependent dehydrogenase (short-subunit alcohol dehydrogenase family)
MTMREFQGKVAVVTGAASGIGRALALRAADEGMSVVVADVDEANLEQTRKLVVERGVASIAVPTDVSKAEAVEALAEAALSEFAKVHLVFNNAGVLLSGRAWERSADDWEWVIGVNLFGCIHGARVFLPILIEQGEPAHMVNTASVGGVLVGPFLGPYIVSKHAVAALSETLYQELQTTGAPVGVSCLCPGAVATGITSSERIRPADRGTASPLASEAEKAFAEGLTAGIATGMLADELAGHAFEGVREGRFWIFPDPVYREAFEARAQSIREGTNPVQPGVMELEDRD